MKNPFRYYHHLTDGLVVEDRDAGSRVASGVDRAYVHRIVDLLNLDAEARRPPSVSELLRAYE